MAVLAGLACAFVIGKALPAMMDTISTIVEPLCAVGDPTGSALDTVEPITSHALPNVPRKRATIVRVFYAPPAFTPPPPPPPSLTAHVPTPQLPSHLTPAP